MISGPYRSGARTPAEAAFNLEVLNRAAAEVFRLGHLPLIGVNRALGVIAAAGEESYEEFMMPLSLGLAERCDAILRIGGASSGADREVERFRARGLPVFTSVDAIAGFRPAGGVAIDHVALLVRSVEAASAPADRLGFPVGKIESFEAEGTRECYVGDWSHTGRLLLLEAAGEGPYRRALKERGPGLHHVALRVGDLDRYLAGLAGSGWYLLPRAFETLRDSGTIWLARPGVPLLVEVNRGDVPAGEPVVSRVEIPAPGERIAALRAPGLVASSDGGAWLTSGGRRFGVEELTRA
ncbi:MAG: VOC family protein [Candidatus Sericytochromatia bacterium]|nr:VOC family protein [Candidatus Tanganyikabacteria bacterium]